jgi:hypothetical protein
VWRESGRIPIEAARFLMQTDEGIEESHRRHTGRRRLAMLWCPSRPVMMAVTRKKPFDARIVGANTLLRWRC